jgi:hypothetical protein
VPGAHEDAQGRPTPALIVFAKPLPGKTNLKTGGDNRMARNIVEKELKPHVR